MDKIIIILFDRSFIIYYLLNKFKLKERVCEREREREREGEREREKEGEIEEI